MEKGVCTVHDEGDITVIRVTEKKLYQDVITPFQNTMVTILESGKSNLIVNLSEVDIMNSSSLGVLILAWDRLSKEGGNLIITGLRPMMDELFQRMRLNLLFTLAETEEEAFCLIRGDKKIPTK